MKCKDYYACAKQVVEAECNECPNNLLCDCAGEESMSKYNNIKDARVGKDGELITFDSRREARRYDQLALLLRAGEITDLQMQVHYELIPKLTIRGKTVRKTEYVADFVYKDKKGNTIVEDAKGMQTDVYKIKKKLMKHVHGIEVIET